MAKKGIKKFSDAEIERAASVSIVDYVTQEGLGELKNQGSKFVKLHYQGHDSLVINTANNTFIHNSAIGEPYSSGNAINFVRYMKGASFPEAVAELLSFNGEHVKLDLQKKREPFVYEYKKAKYNSKAFNYLTRERGIDKDIVNRLFQQGFLIQDTYNNAVFNWSPDGLPISDKNKIVGATQQLTRPPKEGMPKKWIGKNSQQDWGFNIKIGEQVNSIHCFEAIIDMLSYWSLNKDTLNDTWLIAMDGLKPQTLFNFLGNSYNRDKQGFKIFLNVDNDRAGNNFLDSMIEYSGIENIEMVPDQLTLIPSEIERLKGLSNKYHVPFDELARLYLVERPYLSDSSEKNNELEYLYFSDESKLSKVNAKLKKIDTELLWDVPEKMKPRFTERQNRFFRMQGKELMTKDTIVKDWNDVLIEKKRPEPLTKQKLPTLNAYQTFIKERTIRLKETDIQLISQKSRIQPEILRLFANKGWIRKNTITKEIHFVWSKNGEIVGGEKTKEFGTKTEVIQIDSPTMHTESFIYTIGEPKTIKVFDSPTEAISYLNLHKYERDFVAISDNHQPDYLNRKLNEYRQNHNIEKVTECRKEQDNNLGLIVAAMVAAGAIIEFTEELPLNDTWSNELVTTMDYYNLKNSLQPTLDNQLTPELTL